MKMENELLENFVVKINDLQKEINKKYKKEFQEVIKNEENKE